MVSIKNCSFAFIDVFPGHGPETKIVLVGGAWWAVARWTVQSPRGRSCCRPRLERLLVLRLEWLLVLERLLVLRLEWLLDLRLEWCLEWRLGRRDRLRLGCLLD